MISYSGNIGKSTLASQLLLPRIQDAKLLLVETLNAQPIAGVETHDPKRFEGILIALEVNKNVVVDVGSKDAATFIQQASKLDSLTSFDIFIVPTTSAQKVIADAASTIRVLNDHGIDGKRILCLPTRVAEPGDIAADFAGVRMFIDQKLIDAQFDPSLFFEENEVFTRINPAITTIDALANDPTDWGEKLRTATTDEDRRDAAYSLINSKLAKGARRHLDTLFAGIVKASAQARSKLKAA
ncbi:MAG: hypothetical protein AB7P21_30190 [Lautropia sp.]